MAICKRIQAGDLVRENKKLNTDNPKNRAYLEAHLAKIKARLETQQMEVEILNGDGLSVSATADGVAVSGGNALPTDADLASLLAGGGDSKRGNTSFAESASRIGGEKDFSGAALSSSGADGGAVPAAKPMPQAVGAREMLNLPVGQLVRRFGSVDSIEKYSKILRDLSTADEREQRMQEKRLLQVPKDFVVQRVFGYVDLLMNQLLDVPESVCDQVIATVASNGDNARTQVIHILSDNLTRCISGAKEHILEEIESLRNKYDRQDSMAQDMIQEQLEAMR